MNRIRTAACAAAVFLAVAPAAHAHVGWGIGIRFGGPIYLGAYAPVYPGYYYRPVYIEPAPVYVAPAPVCVQPRAVVPTYYESSAPPSAAPTPVQAAPQLANPDVSHHLQQLASADERVRQESVTQLGRLKAQQAVDPLAATLAGDPSPTVREAAARALALIGSRRALPALQRAALADSDRDVRHSAQFAMDIVQAGN